MAATLSLLAFAICLIVGGLQTGNPFTTTVVRALVAMAGTFVLGLMIGAAGQKMLEEKEMSDPKNPKLTVEDKGAQPIKGSGH